MYGKDKYCWVEVLLALWVCVCIYTRVRGKGELGQNVKVFTVCWSEVWGQCCRAWQVTFKYWCQIDCFCLKQNLLVISHFGFCMFETSLFCFHFWQIFFGYRILSWQGFFQYFKDVAILCSVQYIVHCLQWGIWCHPYLCSSV